MNAILALVLAGAARRTRPAPPLRTPYVDYHQHLVSPAFAPDRREAAARCRGAGARARRRRDPRAVVLSVGYSYADERKNLPDPDRLTREENDWTSAQVAATRAAADRLLQRQPAARAALAEIERCLGLPGMIGIKVHVGNAGVTPSRSRPPGDDSAAVRAGAAQASADPAPHARRAAAPTMAPRTPRLFLDQVMPTRRASRSSSPTSAPRAPAIRRRTTKSWRCSPTPRSAATRGCATSTSTFRATSPTKLERGRGRADRAANAPDRRQARALRHGSRPSGRKHRRRLGDFPHQGRR